MTRPGDHAPATGRQSQIMRTDSTLSALIEQALEDKDLDLIVDAMAEKVDLERALDVSRTATWGTWHHNNTGGNAA